MGRILKDYSNVSLKPEDLDGKIDFCQLFGRSGQVHIEIGSGKGTFLVAQAKSQPEVDFLGIEWASKFYRYAVDRIGRWGLDNVRLIRTDAADFISEHLADELVDCFHLYFPDPWPKKRHNKRRFFEDGNLAQMYRCLKAGGRINIATDHADYFAQMTDVIEKNLDKFERIEFQKAAGAESGEFVGTNYERKYIIEGRKTYTAAIRKR